MAIKENINYRCRYFRGAKPCVFNKEDGSECVTCRHASEYRQRILFIKLDAIGDVLRSASVLPAIIERHEAPFIAWLTRPESVELVGMMTLVDEVIAFTNDGLARIMAGGWDRVYSLSNDPTSASLASLAGDPAAITGFRLEGGVVTPTNAAAAHWLQMAAFDRVKKANRESYQKLMLDIVGCSDPAIPPPALRIDPKLKEAAAARCAKLFPGGARRRVAINVGSGARWPKKMLDVAQICQLAHLLLERPDVDIMLVGGEAEAEKTAAIRSRFNGSERVREALTKTSLAEFVAVLNEADVLLCGDTLALHIASAVGLPTVAVFGPTSSAEIFDFGGLISKVWTPELDCLVCYGDCRRERNCMTLLDSRQLADMILARLDAGK